MKVKELIESLSKMDPELVVVVPGHPDDRDYDYMTGLEYMELYEKRERDWSGLLTKEIYSSIEGIEREQNINLTKFKAICIS